MRGTTEATNRMTHRLPPALYGAMLLSFSFCLGIGRPAASADAAVKDYAHGGGKGVAVEATLEALKSAPPLAVRPSPNAAPRTHHGISLSSPSSPDPSVLTRHASPQLDSAFGKLPLSFEPNVGQTTEQAKFLSRGPGYTLFLTPREAVLSLRQRAASPPSPADTSIRSDPSRITEHVSRSQEQSVLRMRFEGASPAPRVEGLDPLPGVVNYFIGSDSKKWRTNIPTYQKVQYKNIYPGIDLVYYGNTQRQLEYDLVVAPGADPTQIKLAFEGAKQTTLAASGDLILTTDTGDLNLKKPLVYQLRKDGQKELIGGNYLLHPVVAASPNSDPLTRHPSPVTQFSSTARSRRRGLVCRGFPIETRSGLCNQDCKPAGWPTPRRPWWRWPAG